MNPIVLCEREYEFYRSLCSTGQCANWFHQGSRPEHLRGIHLTAKHNCVYKKQSNVFQWKCSVFKVVQFLPVSLKLPPLAIKLIIASSNMKYFYVIVFFFQTSSFQGSARRVGLYFEELRTKEQKLILFFFFEEKFNKTCLLEWCSQVDILYLKMAARMYSTILHNLDQWFYGIRSHFPASGTLRRKMLTVRATQKP